MIALRAAVSQNSRLVTWARDSPVATSMLPIKRAANRCPSSTNIAALLAVIASFSSAVLKVEVRRPPIVLKSRAWISCHWQPTCGEGAQIGFRPC